MTNPANIHDVIVAADKAFMSAFSQGDVAAIADLYTQDGQFLPPNGDFVVGRQAIANTFQSFMNSGVKEIKLEALEVEGYGDSASEVGRYMLEDIDGKVLDEGKFVVIWKKEAGQWRLHRDIINTSMPAVH